MSKLDQRIKRQNTHNRKSLQNIRVIRALLDLQLPSNVFIYQLRKEMSSHHIFIDNTLTRESVIVGLISIGLGIILCTFSAWAMLLIFIGLCFIIYGYSIHFPLKELDDLYKDLNNYILEKKYNFKFYTEQNLKEKTIKIKDFPLFNAGNRKNNVHFLLHGNWSIQDQTHPYIIFQYDYINREMVYVSDGKWELKDVRYHLWGIMLENFPIKGISLSAKQKTACDLGVKWESSDIRFNQKYQQSGISEFELARFLSPERILYLEKILDYFPGDFYVHPQKSTLCWICDVNLSKIENHEYWVNTVSDLSDYLEKLSMPNFELFAEMLEHLIIETPKRRSLSPMRNI